jgi:hypothetical protein
MAECSKLIPARPSGSMGDQGGGARAQCVVVDCLELEITDGKIVWLTLTDNDL